MRRPAAPTAGVDLGTSAAIRVIASVARLACAAALVASTAIAEEGGGGHYMPGAMASFFDELPGRPSLGYANEVLYYGGAAGANRSLPFGGRIAARLDASVYADTSLLLWQSEWSVLGAQYGAAIAFPYVFVDVAGDVSGDHRAQHVHDRADGIGDIEVLPVMLLWTVGDLKLGANFAVFVPTGSYDAGQLANVGKNYFTFEPGLSASFLSTTIGLELSAFVMCDFNGENEATHYSSGDSCHVDATVAQHLPLGGGAIGAGVGTFFYRQISADSGAVAVLGAFEGHTVGVGPVVSYVRKLSGFDLAAEVKWLPELDVAKRLEGDIVWAKVGLVF